MRKINSEKRLTNMINQYKRLVFSLCLKMTGDYFAAEDITQETFISVYKNLNKSSSTNEKAWIMRIASNKCIDYLRSSEVKIRSKTEELTDDTYLTTDNPLNSIINKEIKDKLQESILKLKEPYKTICVLYFIEEKSSGEIARIKSQNINTIKTEIRRARKILKENLGKELDRNE